LPEHGTEAARLAHWLDPILKHLDSLLGVDQAPHMGQVAACLEREAESGRRLRRPAGYPFTCGQAVENGVHRDCVKACGVALEPASCGKAWRIAPRELPPRRQRLDGLLEVLPQGRHAIEFRHESWFTAEVLATLRGHDVAVVLGDHPERPFQTLEASASWRYVRFHYGSRGRRGNYSERELQNWALRFSRWSQKGELFAYFSNDWKGFAPRNAAYLRERVDHMSA
jgi:Protein of unknown function DUF72